MTSTDAPRGSLINFVVALLTVGLGTAAGLSLVLLAYGTYLGTLAGGLVAGLVVEDRPLIETGTAAALAGLAVLVAGPLVGTGLVTAVLALGSVSPVTLLTAIVLNFAIGAFGAHFGAEIRDGLTEPVEPPAQSGGLGNVGRTPTSTKSIDATLEDASTPEESTEEAAGDPEPADTDTDQSTEADLERELEGPERTDR